MGVFDKSIKKGNNFFNKVGNTTDSFFSKSGKALKIANKGLGILNTVADVVKDANIPVLSGIAKAADPWLNKGMQATKKLSNNLDKGIEMKDKYYKKDMLKDKINELNISKIEPEKEKFTEPKELNFN